MASATAFVRPHDIRIGGSGDSDVTATVERVTTLGWLARLTLRLPGGGTVIAHVPQHELHGADEGATVSVDLRNPKAFARQDGSGEPEAPAVGGGDEPGDPVVDVSAARSA